MAKAVAYFWQNITVFDLIGVGLGRFADDTRTSVRIDAGQNQEFKLLDLVEARAFNAMRDKFCYSGRHHHF